MNEEGQILEVGREPSIEISGEGNLQVLGEDRTTVALEAPGEVNFESEANSVRVRADGPGTIRVPAGSTLRVETVERGLTVEGITGPVTISTIGSHLTLNNTGPAEIASVGASLKAHAIRGDLTVATVGGAARVADVVGRFEARQIGGSLKLAGLGGGLLATCGGSATLALDPRPGESYDVTAGGSIRCAIPEGADADVRILSGADQISVHLAEARVAKGHGSRIFTLGAGGAEIVLRAGGTVRLGSGSGVEDNPEAADLELEFERRMEEFGRAMGTWGETFGAEFGGVGEQLAERITRAVDRAQRRAAQKIERQLSKAVARQEHFIRTSRPPRPPRPPRPARGLAPAMSARGTKPVSDPVSEEERRMILRMLQEGKVSAEQADELLLALGNR